VTSLSADEGLLERLAGDVKWDAVSAREAASFGLALGTLRDAQQWHGLRRAAWGTSIGGAASACVLASFTALVLDCRAALVVVLISQAARTAWLWAKQLRTALDVRSARHEAIEAVNALARAHPL
jgi:hypothetical protein